MKRVFRILLLMIIMTPLFLHATENYSDSERRANNYINGEAYSTRNKYLIYGSGTPYKFVNGKASIDGATPASSAFKNGGLLNVEEYELSRNDSSSYLITGSPYWTMTGSTTGQFFIGKYRVEAANSDSMRLSHYDTRVTEFVKPIIKVGGSGKYADPWYFISNFNVNITTNNKDYGKFEYNGEVTEAIDASVEPGELFEVKMKTTKGYKYSGQDQCGFKVSAVNPDVFSVTVNRDIYCQAYFNEKVYKFTLDSEKYSTDPFPKELYYKFEDGWYQHYDRNTDKVSEKKLFISSPERVGYDFAGYTYNGVTVIDKYGNLHPIPADKVIDSNDTQSLTAVWNPRSDTKYTVNHFVETCNGSYELKQSVVLQGTTDTTVEIPKISLTGFGTPATISAKIKDDGTLVVRYNYLRVSKNVTVNKGTGIATVSGGGTYKYGCNYTLSSTLNTGYKWVNYTGNSTINEITKTLQMGISDVNYTANGTGISYQVHYVKNDDDATGTMSDSTHVYGTPKELTNIGYSKLGYNFTGWSKTPTGNIVYSNKEQVSNLTTTDGDVINLYAHYELADPATPTITGGATKVYGASATTLTCTTSTNYQTGTNKYYSFGYATSDGGTPSNWTSVSTTNTLSISATAYVGARYYSCRVYASNGTITTGTTTSLTTADAPVIINNATITFNANGGTISGTTPLYTKSSETGLFTGIRNTTAATAPKTGKVGTYFDGWYTAASGGTKVINANGTLVSGTVSGYVASGKWTTTQNRTLYAHNINCSAGTYNPSADNFTCTDCPAGYYCTGGSNKTACPKATYRTATKGKQLSDCTSCGKCKTTPGTAQTSNTCTWNYGDGSRNNQAKGYQGKLAIASSGTCYTDLYNRWIDNWNNTYLWISYGNYGLWDWKSTNDHGYCSDNVLKTSGFHQAFFGARKSWIGVCKKSSGDCGIQSDACNKAPLSTSSVSEVGTHANGRNLGIAMTSGTKKYTFPSAVSGGNTIWFAIRNGGCGGEMTMGNIKLKISGSYYTIKQMVDNGYVEKLVIVSGESFKTNTVNAEYTGGSMGTGRWPGSDIIFMLKSGYSFQGFEAYLSKDAHPGKIDGVEYACGDGYYVRYLSTDKFRLVMNSSVVN